MSHGLTTLATALAGFGLTWAFQSSALLAVGLLAGRLLRRSGPAVQSGVYRTTLAAVLVCPLTSAVLTAAGYDGLTFRLSAPTTDESPTVDLPGVALASAPPAHVVVSETSDPMALKGAAEPSEPALSPAEPPRRRPLFSGVPAIPQPASASSWTKEVAAVAGLSVWLLGATVMVTRLLIGHLRMTRLRATAVAAEPGAGVLCRELAERMGVSSPAVFRSPFLFSPCLDGLWRPAILLPDDVGGSLRDTFVHELAHLARRDGLWNLLRRSSVAVLWVQPLLWILSKRLEGTAEEVCDDYVVQFGADRTRYAGHLLELARRTLPPSAPAGVGMVSLRSMLSRRIVRLLDTSRSLSTRAGKRAVLAMLVAGLAGTLLAGLLVVDGRKREAKAQEPAKAVEVKDGPGRPEDAPAAKAARPDVPISGRIVSLEGRPVLGVSVKIHDVRVPKSGDLSSWLEGVKRGEPPWITGEHLDWDRKTPAAALRETTTDADGRFRFEGLGAECIVELTLQGGTMAATRIEVVTRTMDPIPARGFPNQHGPGFQTIHGADFTFTAAPSRTIEGVIKEAETGRPLADMEVRSNRFAGSDFVGTMTLTTKTDARGRFRLSGMPKGEGNQMIVVPDDEQPYLVQGVDAPNPPGGDPVSVEVSLPRGIWIEGRLTEKATGTPVPGAWLHYIPFRDNTFAQEHPAFDRHGNSDNSAIQDRYLTKADGSFRLVGLPGRAIVGANVHKKAYLQGVGSEAIAGLNKWGQFETYRSPVNPGKLWPTVMKEINPAVESDVVRVDLQVTTGLSARLRVVDAAGDPVTGASTRGLTGRSSYESETLTGPDTDVSNLRPDEERIVVVKHPGRKIGKALLVRKGDDANGPVVAQLEALAAMTGRVVDADGNPVRGATVRPDLLPSGDFSLSLPQVGTDEQGRFSIPEVPTGCDYALVVESSGGIKDRRVAFLNRATVKPGETTDVGEIRFKND